MNHPFVEKFNLPDGVSAPNWLTAAKIGGKRRSALFYWGLQSCGRFGNLFLSTYSLQLDAILTLIFDGQNVQNGDIF